MPEIVKSLMELVKGRKTNSDLLYRWFACAAAMLTIAAYMRHQRPSDVLADVMHVSNFESASAWFTTGLPPVLAMPNQIAQQIVLLITEILVMAMLFLPFIVAQQERRSVEWQAQGLLGARAPSTVWILLVVASQLGPPNWFTIWPLSVTLLLFVVALVIAGSVNLAIRLLGFRNSLDFSSQKFPPLARDVVVVVCMAIVSFIFVVIAPFVEVAIWAGSIESNSFFETNVLLEKESGECERPTGAKSIQVSEE